MGERTYPLAIEHITPQWLTAVLRERYPDCEVLAASPTEVMHGTATKIRLQLTYQRSPRGLPQTIVVKGGFSAHRELMYREYKLEALFYRDVAPRLQGVRIPICHYAGWNDEQRQAIVLLDDLDAAGASFCRVQRPLSFAQASGFVDALAQLHGQWWMRDEFAAGNSLGGVEDLDPFPDGPLGTYQRSRIQPAVYAECMALPRGLAVSHRFHDRDRMEQALERLRKVDREGPRCLLHTDPHLGNLYFDSQSLPGILDWQSLRRGPWAHDLNYFIVSSLDMLDRREWEKPLLSRYLARLRDCGVTPPTLEQAWEEYRRHTVYGLYYWLVNPVEFQTEVNNCAVAPRFAFAAIDHDTFSLLGL